VQPAVTRFIILAAARTGSNLLRELLASQPGVFTGGEVFNYKLIGEGFIPWYEIGPPSDERANTNSDQNLIRLWHEEPELFLEKLINVTAAWGYHAIGFKTMYELPNPEDPAGRYLVGDKSIRVIHLKRRNLLRRRVSWERALATDKWFQFRGSEAPELPVITLPITEVVHEFISIEAKQKQYDECFKEHPMLEVFYEDLERDPQAVGARALSFLGIQPDRELKVRLEKTGVDPLRAAVGNYDELRSALIRWASFFED
jgi:LPS sulfotransferase NodH